jgi:hypothetical protein
VRSPRLLLLALVAVLAVGTVACGSSDDDTDVSSGGDGSTTSTTAAPTSTSTTEAPTSTTSTTAAPSADGLVLGADGLAVVELGEGVEAAIEAMEGALGPADDDSDWVDAAGSDYGFCPAPQVRALTWGDLTLLFSDGDTAYGSGGDQHLFVYRLDGSTPSATTEAGIAIGSTSADVRAAYGDAATQVPGDEIVAPRFDVDLGGTEPLRLTLDDSGTVVAVEGGQPCGE